VLVGVSVAALLEFETVALPLPLTFVTTHSTANDKFFVVLSEKVTTAFRAVEAPLTSDVSTEEAVIDCSAAFVTVMVVESVSPKYLPTKLNTPGPVDVNFVPSDEVTTEAVLDPLTVETTHSIAEVIVLVVLSDSVASADMSVELPLAKLLDSVLILIDCGMAATCNAFVVELADLIFSMLGLIWVVTFTVRLVSLSANLVLDVESASMVFSTSAIEAATLWALA